jgi:hypothetical protein
VIGGYLLSLQEAKLNIKRRIIRWLKTGNLKCFIIITFVMFIPFSGDITDAIYNSLKSEEMKNQLLILVDYSTVVKVLIPNNLIRWGLALVVAAIWLLIFYFRLCCEESESLEKPKKVIHVLGHSTLCKSQFRLDEKSNKTTELDVQELDLIEQFNEIKTDYGKLNYVVSLQDMAIKQFKSKINNNDKYGYMGISHTPLILRAGYQIRAGTKLVLFHKKRDMDYYEELNDSNLYVPIKIEKKDIKDSCKELIVAISTTFLVKDSELNILQPDNKSIIKFKTDELGFDVITSKKQVEEYVISILSEIRKIVKDNGITKIHMVISSSVAFTFALGQALSNNYDPEIIIYHFDINNPKKYPWGISLSKDFTEAIIVN